MLFFALQVLIAAASKHKLGTGVTIGAVVVLLAAAVFGVYTLILKTRHVPFERFSIENLTNNGHVILAAISPDGKYLVNVKDENGLQSLWLRHIPTASNTQVVAPAGTRYGGLTFRPTETTFTLCVATTRNKPLHRCTARRCLAEFPKCWSPTWTAR